jgi:hypothetical protein
MHGDVCSTKRKECSMAKSNKKNPWAPPDQKHKNHWWQDQYDDPRILTMPKTITTITLVSAVIFVAIWLLTMSPQ